MPKKRQAASNNDSEQSEDGATVEGKGGALKKAKPVQAKAAVESSKGAKAAGTERKRRRRGLPSCSLCSCQCSENIGNWHEQGMNEMGQAIPMGEFCSQCAVFLKASHVTLADAAKLITKGGPSAKSLMEDQQEYLKNQARPAAERDV
jgi:hypothetical protein